MEVLSHLDPAVLERELLSRVSACQSGGPARCTLVIVPTSRLAEHVQRRLVELEPAWLGVEVLHFRALARRILERAGAPRLQLLSPRLLEALLRDLLRRAPEGDWSRFSARRPRAVRRLAGSLAELREAGIEPGALSASIGNVPRDRDLAGIYGRYCAALQELAGKGWVDEAGLVRAALPHAGAFAASCKAVFLHGAYELIGIHLDLLRELDRSRTAVVLLPARIGAPVSAYAAGFARRHLLQPGETVGELNGARESDRARMLAALYDEESSPEPAGPDLFSFNHAQGAAGEVRSAIREALAAFREGVPANEIVIAARGLTPYAAPLEESFERERLPWTSSLATPLRRDPFVHDLLLVVRALERDFPRRATAEILRSPRIRWRTLVGREGSSFPGDRADRWSRRAGIVGGLAEWTDGLAAWAGEPVLWEEQGEEERKEAQARARERVAGARRIGRALSALRERVEPELRRSWGGHARSLEQWIEALLRPEPAIGGDALDAVRGLLDEMRALETVLGQGGDVSFGEMAAWLEDAVDGAELSPWREDRGGIRVLDAMQLRGLTCRRLFLLGLNAGQLPHAPRQDPILGDELRQRLREKTGRPLPVKSEAVQEERLLLSLLLGIAGERIHVYWQRADEAGRARTPSLALRELARVALGRPNMESLVDGARHLPSHPAHWLGEMAVSPGLLAPGEERLLAVLRSRGPGPALKGFFPELAAGLAMLEATEEFTRIDPEWDGRVGPLALPKVFSTSALEQLGRCPLQYFFQRVLRVRELEDEARAFELEKREMGSRAHLLLQRLYGSLDDEGLFAAGRAEALSRRALALVQPAWDEVMGGLGLRMSRRAPVLWATLRRRWIDSLAAFLAEDLERLATRGWSRPILEQMVQKEINLGGPSPLHVRGRFDRLQTSEDGPVVADYKTGGIKKRKLDDATEMLRARALQVPLYWLLAGPGATVEVLGVGPDHDFGPGSDENDRRLRFGGFDDDAQRSGFLETLRTLVSLVEQGAFPIHTGEHCAWCPYELACRKGHAPTNEREDSMADVEDYRLLEKKTKSKLQTLAKVRQHHGSEDER